MILKNNLILISAWVIFQSSSFVFAQDQEDYKILREIIQNEFQEEIPLEGGINIAGVLRRFQSTDKKVAIILEACLDTGADIDGEIFNQLNQKKIPASFFIDQGWLQKNSDQLRGYISSGRILLENHGAFCRPLSITGKGVKNHPGTSSVDDVFEEVEKNAREIESFSGRLPRFFKSGYGFYDDVSLKIVTVLGYIPIEGDLKLKAKDVLTDETLNVFLQKVQTGSIIVIPANRPSPDNAWVPKLLDGLSHRGFQVVGLDDVIGAEDSLV